MQAVAAIALRSRVARRAAAGSLAVGVAVIGLIGTTALALVGSLNATTGDNAITGSARSAGCYGSAVISGTVTAQDLSADQKQTAADIVSVGRSLNVPDDGLIVAIATAMQESGLRQIDYGDRDSLGPFQQRSSWGPAPDRINALTSARRFFLGGDAGQRGLLGIPNWQQLPVTVAAQSVQVSAFPDAYAKWEPLAVQVVGASVTDPAGLGGCANS